MFPVLVALAMLSAGPAPAEGLKVGLIGQGSAAQAQGRAFADFVHTATGQETTAAVFSEYDGLSDAVAQGQVDIAFMPPIALVRAQAKAKPRALLTVRRSGETTYRSVLIVPLSSKLRSLSDLAGASNLKAAWVDVSSSAGYIFPKAHLLQNHIDPAGIFNSQDFLGSHDAVCAAVAEAKVDVGAAFSDDGTSPAVHVTACGDRASGVRILSTSAKIPNDTLVVRAGLPDATRDAVSRAALALNSTPSGKEVLRSAFLADAFVPVVLADYISVKEALAAFKK